MNRSLQTGRKLAAFLVVDDREEKAEALRNITRKYIKMRREEKKSKDKILHEVPLVKAKAS